jgi:SecD/SecF fusion protein
MKNYGSRFLLIFVILALAGWQWAERGLRYGLDLAGGAALSYRVEREAGRAADEQIDINTILAIIEKRVNAFGLAEISLTATDDNEVLIEVPGRSKEQLDDIKSIIERNGKLEFRMLASESEQREELEKRELFKELYRTPPNRQWYPSAEEGRPPQLVEVLEQTTLQERDALLERQAAGENVDAELLAKEQELAEIMRREVFKGEDLVKTAVQRQTTEIVVFFEMRRERKGDFGDYTERNLKRQMAIILDGKVNSAPVIQSPLPGEGIISGGGRGGFKEKEARDLSIVLESGATGANLVLEREDLLGPSLGADAIDTGKMSILIGFVCVLLIMLWLYRAPGLIANFALLMNVVILLGALAFFSAALTLAGIAGVVLTLGMAVDANILIFERLREERSRGKSLVEALAAGYDRAIVAIVDANVTTVLTAIVLIVMGSGTVKGFGYTLTIGILASMFTAIYVTRTVFEWGIATGVMKRLGFGTERKVTTIDFMRVRKWFTGPSLALMAIGFAVFLARDEAESKDLEFVGGQQTVVQLQEAVSRPDLVKLVGTDDYSGISAVRLDPRGVDVASDEESNRWQVRVPLNDRAAGEAFVAHVQTTLGDKLLSDGFTDYSALPADGGKSQVSFTLHALELPEGVTAESVKAGLSSYVEEGKAPPFTSVEVTPGEGEGTFLVKALVPRALDAAAPTDAEDVLDPRKAVEIFARDNARLALQKMDQPVYLSDPMPSVSFLNPGRAEQLWRSALRAVLLAMLLQIVYIRLRFADFKHGFAAVCALIHDVTIALGFVAVFDASGLVYAKINLVLIAAFLTLIGYSMNDTIVVFDRIRENMGRSKVVRSKVVNEAVNQTLTRSIRTSITTWIVVLIQFILNRGTGSVLEGFAWVMVIGVISGTYSSIFIAGPLLLFLPGYWRKLSANRKLLMGQLIATVVGGIVAITAKGHGPTMLVGLIFAANIPIHFLLHFIPWIGFGEPDSLLQEEIDAEEKQRPLKKPGI